MRLFERLSRRRPITQGSAVPFWPEAYGQAVAGHWALLYFFPRADTPGCTRQSCALAREPLPEEWVVVGISPDLPSSLTAFRLKYGLEHALVSDASGRLARAFGVQGRRGLRRCSFVVGPDGLVRAVLVDVDPETHRDTVLRVARAAGAPG